MFGRTAFKTFGLAAVLGLATLTGCSAFEGDSNDDDDFRVSRDRDEDVILSGDRYDDRYRDRDRDRDRDRYDPDVDIAPSTANKVPRDARVVDSGSNSLSYTAREDGSVYLYDEDARAVVFDARLRDGDRVSVDPDANRIEVNGRQQGRIDLKSDHNFRLYFLEGLKSTRNRDRF